MTLRQQQPRLVDTFGRRHDNLRISVTDRCNIRCFYCMPQGDPSYMPRRELLTYEEIARVAAVAAGLGVDKIRLTGGEPLVRRDLPELLAMLAAVPGIRDLALTTNGILLPDMAAPLYRAGLRRINVHLDTLEPARFRAISRRDGLDRVLAGIRRCQELGYRPIKVNAVAVHGLSEPDLIPLARFGREQGLEVRYIEYMPLGAGGEWRLGQVLSAERILAALAEGIGPLVPAPDQDPRSPASEYIFTDGLGRIGIIASVTRPFCGTCNRLRLTADGKLRNCLFALDELDVRGALRGGGSDEDVARLLHRSVGAKWEGHEINTARFVQPERPMFAIGG